MCTGAFPITPVSVVVVENEPSALIGIDAMEKLTYGLGFGLGVDGVQESARSWSVTSCSWVLFGET